jgi:hypothetical protein
MAREKSLKSRSENERSEERLLAWVALGFPECLEAGFLLPFRLRLDIAQVYKLPELSSRKSN